MGRFINFYLAYQDGSGRTVPARDQAHAIIAEAQELIDRGSPGVAIIYSANYDQTLMIRKTYGSGGWDTHTDGANQGQVMAAMEAIMGSEFASLKHQLEIAPITTMTYSGYGGQTHEHVIESDLTHIKSLLDKGWDVLGWQNQDSVKNPTAPYAVGNSTSGPLPKTFNDLIQSTLAKYAVDYPVKPHS